MLALEACARQGGCEGVSSLSLISTPPSTACLVADRLSRVSAGPPPLPLSLTLHSHRLVLSISHRLSLHRLQLLLQEQRVS